MTGLFGLIICGKTLRNRLAAESERRLLGPEDGRQSSEKPSPPGMSREGSSLVEPASPGGEHRARTDSGQEKGIDEFLIESGVDDLCFVASRRDVESGDTDKILGALRKLLAPKVAARFRNRVTLAVHGYDDDPRELPQIPEVRAWVQKLDRDFPYWLFYLNMNDPSFAFVVLSLCQCDMTSDGIRVDEQNIARFVDQRLVAMRQLCTQFGYSKEQSAAMTREVLRAIGATGE